MRATPIAVIGLACRLPHAPDPAAFWRLLRRGESAIGTIPPDRGASRAWPGGFIDDVASFDAEFFGISPREAVAMDPQQRLMLELTWEALEDAGIRPPSLAGSDTGIFVAAIWDDYAALLRRSGLDGSNRHVMTGAHRSIIANRVSYSYDFSGPSLLIDTAQSSSLVAVHVACESLRRGECALALVAGVNLILAEDSMKMTAQLGALSPDGRCYTFDARANGFVRGEGGGAVLLKPLTAALRDGDSPYCVILGGAINNDGGTDALTIPSALAQENVLRKAYCVAGVSPADIQYVELHGSGTPVGDPVEAAALGAVLGPHHPVGSPLPVGSVKTNLGHLEGAGGIAGLIKTALSLKHGQLPPSLNFTTPNPRIPLEQLGLRVQDRLTGWPHPDRPLLAGVSSFGMGGTNCHVVLGQAPVPDPAVADARPVVTATTDVPWPLSARSWAALAAQAGRLRRHITEHPDEDPAEVGYSLGITRCAFSHRAVVFGKDIEERLGQLADLQRRTDAAGVINGQVTGGGLAVLFSGQGSQRVTMGHALYAAYPQFANALNEAWSLLDPHLERPLRDATLAAASLLDQAALSQAPYTRAAVFAIDVALYRLAESWGLRADFVLGHSVGEVAAVHVAGALPLADACALVIAQGRLIEASHADAELEELRAVVSGLSISAPAVPVVSSVTGQPATVEQLGSADYWAEQAREPGRIESGLRLLYDSDIATLLELGPDAQLTTMADEYLAGLRVPGRHGPVALAALRADRSETAAFAAAMAEVYARGTDLNWEQVFAGRRSRRVSLPTYAFQRSRYWPDAVPGPAPGQSASAMAPPADRAPILVEGSPFAQRLAGLNDADRDKVLLETVRAQAALVLGHAAPAAVNPSLTFKKLGFDSIAGTELSRRLGAATGLPLLTTLIFDYPTPDDLVVHLRDLVLHERTAPPERRAVGGDSSDDPIVIVGMACRFPGGVVSPEGLWELVVGGVDAVGEFPVNRGWDLGELFDPDPDRAGRSYARTGGFLHDADLFDAAFFGISPREAVAMDPQQRLLLEAAWQALGRAGIDPATLRGSETGVIIGATTQDYGPRMHEASDNLDGQLLTGTTPSVMAGRLAYTFGLEGPAITVDTACSSSLVAMHLAGQSLRQGECSLALAGGVTVMATPGMFLEFSRQRGLSRDGRCKAFAAAADGTGWAEGVGVVVLERLSDARRNGRQVLAIIRGSAVNSDGASNGLTAPNGPAQERVIRQALANAGLTTADIDAVEAHGTGTTLGDPIEANALLATYGQGRSAGRPLWLGTVKSNIGHAQAAAGVAGVIKMVMAMRHGLLPATLHVDAPSPHVDWSAGEVRLLTEPVNWPLTGRPRRAGVSSFGISGTNAHLILEQPADVLTGAAAVGPGQFNAAAVGPGQFSTAAAGPGQFSTAAAGPGPGPFNAAATRTAPVFVFPGQGSQWAGMGAELLESSPVFAARIADCERALAPHVDWSLTEVLRGSGAELSRVDVVQPALWAVMVSLAAEWIDHGVVPAAVIGHSQGEIAAACVAGALALDDAARIVAVRSRALRRLSGQGAMASLLAAGQQVSRLIAQADGVTVAAVNSPATTVISGPPGQVAAVVAAAQERGLRARMIDVDYASHGPQVDQITGELTEALADITPASTRMPFYSTVTGQLIDTIGLDAGYWVTNLRQPVRFAEAIAVLLADGYQTFVEASPNPVLITGIEECAEEAGVPVAALPTLHRDHGGREQLLKALARAFTAGVDVGWTGRQRQRYWLSGRPEAVGAADLGLSSTGHPMLGASVEPAHGDDLLLTGRVARHRQPWLADHIIAETMLVPGAAQLEWVLRAADEVGCGAVEELVIHTPLAVPELGGVSIQVMVGAAADDGRRPVGVYSRAGTGWSRHATAVLCGSAGPAESLPGVWPPAGAEPVDLAGFYDQAAAAGYGYGPVFQGLRMMWRHGSDIFAEIELPETTREHDRYGVHPALLDAALHPLLAGRFDDAAVWLPFSWNNVALHASGATSIHVRLSALGQGPDHSVRLTVADPAGGSVLDAEVTLRQADRELLRAAAEHARADLSHGANGDAVPRRPAASIGRGQHKDWAHRLADVAAGERQRIVLDLVRGHSAAVLGYAGPAEVPLDAAFTEMGLGSVMAVELRDRLVSATGLMLPVAVIFGHPTPRRMADELLRRLGSDGVVASPVHCSAVAAVAGPVPGEEESEVVDRLRSASAEQVLDFIDNELGVS